MHVYLATGKVTVTSQQPISTDKIREVVEEAGYCFALLNACAPRSPTPAPSERGHLTERSRATASGQRPDSAPEKPLPEPEPQRGRPPQEQR